MSNTSLHKLRPGDRCEVIGPRGVRYKFLVVMRTIGFDVARHGVEIVATNAKKKLRLRIEGQWQV
jgi:hypothetical protein